MLLRLTFSLSLFLGSMGAGWWLHRRSLLTELSAAQLVRWVVTVSSPIVLCLSLWKTNLHQVEPWLLPLVGLVISASTLLPSIVAARRMNLSRQEIGSFLACAFFSNVGYLGAFTAFAIFGEAAYGLCLLYMVFFSPSFYTLGFWIASHYGRGSLPSGFAVNEKLRLYPFIGMLLGVVLSLSGVRRPLWLESFNHLLIPVDTSLYLIAVGSQLRFQSPLPWWRTCLAMSAIKFLYTPLVAWMLVTLLRVSGLPRFVVLLEASTPVAVSPLVLPLLFGVDRKLANALWLFTTLVAIPWLIVVMPLLQRL